VVWWCYESFAAAEFVAALLGCGLCVDFEGKMLYLSDHQESTGSKDIGRKLLSSGVDIKS
jgi:hypothetical protein